jgi:hypothetical protein
VLDAYLLWVRQWPLVSAMLQFALLGTLGDVIAAWLVAGRTHRPFGFRVGLLKLGKWALLAVPIKLAFIGFPGFVAALGSAGYLPAGKPVLSAFAASLAINLQFGPLLVVVHRWLNNGISGQQGWAGLDRGLWSLAWFWLPAHTLSFALPVDYRIGLAALWSLVLGLILGFSARATSAVRAPAH